MHKDMNYKIKCRVIVMKYDFINYMCIHKIESILQYPHKLDILRHFILDILIYSFSEQNNIFEKLIYHNTFVSLIFCIMYFIINYFHNISLLFFATNEHELKQY